MRYILVRVLLSIIYKTAKCTFPCYHLHLQFQIIVLENGKVAEQGPHDVLLSRAGRYAQLWAQQNNNEASDAAVKVEAWTTTWAATTGQSNPPDSIWSQHYVEGALVFAISISSSYVVEKASILLVECWCAASHREAYNVSSLLLQCLSFFPLNPHNVS